MNNPQLFSNLAQLAVRSWQPYYDRPVAVNGHVVAFKAPFMATVGKAIVTDFDCSECGEHDEQGCRHLDAMLEAYATLRDEILHQAHPDIDSRREAHYSAGLYPTIPLS